MVACKTVGEYKRNQEKIRKFCLEEKAALAKQEAKAKRTRATPLQSAPIPQNQPGPSQSVINTQPLGHSELVAMAKRNQQAHKRQRSATKKISKPSHRQIRPQPMTHKSPGSPKRAQWIKNAKARLTKPSSSSVFDQKSKAAALQHSKESKLQDERKLIYSSSSDSKSFTSVNTAKLKFSPTVKIHSIEPESPGTPPFEIVTSSDPNDFMNDNNESTQSNQPSCSYSPTVQKRSQGIMKSTPKLDKIVNKIWNQPNHEGTTLDNSSTDDFPIQPPILQIEVVYLDSTTSNNADVPVVDISEDTTANNPEVPRVEPPENIPPISNNELPMDDSSKDIQEEPPIHEEEHKTPATSPAKSSISSIHMSDFYNQDEF